MDTILLVILTVVTLVLLARVLVLTRNLGASKSPDQVGPSINEIADKVQIATQESLNSALKTISEQARQDREESIRIATDSNF